MKILIVLICFLAFSIQSSAQDYTKYYQGINNAKLALIEDNLENAVTHYYKTFENFDFVFARDCFNALEVSTKLKHFEMVDYFLKRCLKQGVEFDYLQQKSMLDEYKQTNFWTKFLIVKDSLRDIYEKNVNWKIRSEIIEMFTEDQRIRDLADKNRLNPFKIRKLKKQFEEIDRKFVLRIIEITKEFGFPGEKIIGIDNNSMHPKIHTNRLTTGMPMLIFIHHYSQPNQSYNSILMPEIKKGNLLNEHYATICDFQYTYGKGKYGEIPYYNPIFSNKLDLKLMNKNRKKIYLLSVDEKNEIRRKNIITQKYVLY